MGIVYPIKLHILKTFQNNQRICFSGSALKALSNIH